MKKEIYLAGGCFWGVEKYLSSIQGVLETEVGYANGNTENPTYEQVCRTGAGHAETVKVLYDTDEISLSFLLSLFYNAIDPVAINRQGPDIGSQYRSGIYYTDEEDKEVITASIAALQTQYKEPIAIQVKVLKNYYTAEQYHQKYLDKNPGGYCHIRPHKFEEARNATVDPTLYQKPSDEQLREALTEEQYRITQEGRTELPFKNPYHNTFRAGIYVDITTGEPLFVSSDKFESGCGWPSFSKPISPEVTKNLEDLSYGMSRTEVRSRVGDAHLGHVFPDGPKESGGLRYCINSASLRFVPKDEMEKEGYGKYLPLVKE